MEDWRATYLVLASDWVNRPCTSCSAVVEGKHWRVTGEAWRTLCALELNEYREEGLLPLFPSVPPECLAIGCAQATVHWWKETIQCLWVPSWGIRVPGWSGCLVFCICRRVFRCLMFIVLVCCGACLVVCLSVFFVIGSLCFCLDLYVWVVFVCLFVCWWGMSCGGATNTNLQALLCVL